MVNSPTLPIEVGKPLSNILLFGAKIASLCNTSGPYPYMNGTNDSSLARRVVKLVNSNIQTATCPGLPFSHISQSVGKIIVKLLLLARRSGTIDLVYFILAANAG